MSRYQKIIYFTYLNSNNNFIKNNKPNYNYFHFNPYPLFKTKDQYHLHFIQPILHLYFNISSLLNS